MGKNEPTKGALNLKALLASEENQSVKMDDGRVVQLGPVTILNGNIAHFWAAILDGDRIVYVHDFALVNAPQNLSTDVIRDIVAADVKRADGEAA